MRTSRIFAVFMGLVAVLVVMVLQPGCEKREKTFMSSEDFIKELKGEWFVYEVHQSPFPETDSIQYWTITENHDELKLVTRDFYGDTMTYRMQCSDYHYIIPINGNGEKDLIEANTKLVASNATTISGVIKIYLHMVSQYGVQYDKRLEYVHPDSAYDEYLYLYDRSF